MVRDTRSQENGSGGFGMEITSGATLTAESCEVTRNTGMGIAISDPATRVTLEDTNIRDTLPGWNGDFGYGLEVLFGAALAAEGCEVTNNVKIGILAVHPGTQVTLRDSTISETTTGNSEQGMTAIGLAVQDGASATSSGLVVRDIEGPSVGVWANDARLACADCTLLGNQFAGAAVLSGGTLEIEGSLVGGTIGSTNLGGGVGVLAANQWGWGPPSLAVSDSTISDNLVAGAWLEGEGDYRLERVIVTGGIGVQHGTTTRCGDGVFAAGTTAWEESSGLVVQDCALTSNNGAGLFLDDASAQLSGNAWSGNEPDLWLQGDACRSPSDDYDGVPSTEICPTWDQPTCELEFRLNLEVAQLDPAIPPPPEAPHLPIRMGPDLPTP